MFKGNLKVSIKNKLKTYERLTYDILDGMVDWVRVIDNNGFVIYVNKAMERDSDKDLIGTRCYELLGRNCPCEKCITEITMATGLTAEKEELVGDRLFSVKSSPVRDIDGNIYACVEVFRDVTRERKLEKKLMDKNRKMNKDLAFSRTLQQKILPNKGKYGPLLVDYIYRPSEALSGDMFDVFYIDDRHIGIYICDVVGHGITASMMTMFVRQTMRAIKDYVISPAEALSELHQRFLDLNLDDDKYFTIFYGVIDNYDKTLTYVNGGHNCIPMLINDEEIKLLEISGYPISYLFDNIKYEENKIEINKGNKLLLYTDGIIEARNKMGEQFGLERLLEIVKHRDENVITLIEEKINKFKYHTQEDDFAILKAKVIE